jgi:hypothetical protein
MVHQDVAVLGHVNRSVLLCCLHTWMMLDEVGDNRCSNRPSKCKCTGSLGAATGASFVCRGCVVCFGYCHGERVDGLQSGLPTMC